MTKIAIIGSRGFDDSNRMKSELYGLNISLIISGGARGADKLAERYAAEYNIPIKMFEAQWDKYRKRAGFLRNYDIIDNADVVFCVL